VEGEYFPVFWLWVYLRKTFQSFDFECTWWRPSNLLTLVYLMKTFQSFDFSVLSSLKVKRLESLHQVHSKSKDWKVFIKYTQSQKIGKSSSSTLKSKDWKVLCTWWRLSNLLTLSVLDEDFPIFWLWVYLMKTFQSFDFECTWGKLSSLFQVH
jgi:hypothetical protein